MLDDPWVQRPWGAIRSTKRWVTLGWRADGSTKPWVTPGWRRRIVIIYCIIISVTLYGAIHASPNVLSSHLRAIQASPNVLSSGLLPVSAATKHCVEFRDNGCARSASAAVHVCSGLYRSQIKGSDVFQTQQNPTKLTSVFEAPSTPRQS